MSYSYSGGQSWGGYGNSQFTPYNRSYQNSRYNNMRSYRGAQQPRKRSGARITFKDETTPIISAWKKDRFGFHVLYARPYSKTKRTKSKSEKRWLNLFVTITNRSTMQETKCSGMFDLDRQRLYISDLNLIVNPKAPNGGYFGKHISRR